MRMWCVETSQRCVSPRRVDSRCHVQIVLSNEGCKLIAIRRFHIKRVWEAIKVVGCRTHHSTQQLISFLFSTTSVSVQCNSQRRKVRTRLRTESCLEANHSMQTVCRIAESAAIDPHSVKVRTVWTPSSSSWSKLQANASQRRNSLCQATHREYQHHVPDACICDRKDAPLFLFFNARRCRRQPHSQRRRENGNRCRDLLAARVGTCLTSADQVRVSIPTRLLSIGSG